MGDWIRELLRGRPRWMNALMLFCGYMAVVYMPWDFLVKPAAEDVEVWFGVMFTGGWAKLLEIPHWAVYIAGAYGFSRMRAWLWPWASIYVAQIALGMLIWNALNVEGAWGVLSGLVSFAAFGTLSVALWRARPHFERPRPSLRERYGEWALVTGASAGIGVAFARALARQGMSCVLTARREDRLRELAAELEKDHQVATRIVAVDLAEADGPERLAQAVVDLEIGVLVNNAGFGYAGRFEKQDLERLRAMIRVNCWAPVLLTGRLLPGMRERGRGAVVIVGSVAGRQPLPLHGVYSATKGFDLLFGESLWGELRGSGIDALVLEPGPTATEFQEVAGELPHPGQSADEVVATALDALGRQPSVISGWFNWLRANAAGRLAPRSLVAVAAERVVSGQTPEVMR